MERQTERRLEVRSPSHFTNREILMMGLICALPSLLFGALLVLGCTAVIGALGSVLLGGDSMLEAMGAQTVYFVVLLGVGFAALACSCVLLFFMPSLLAVNPYVKRIVRRFLEVPSAMPEKEVFQISLHPRLFSGLRAFLEDADDVGVLTLGADAVSFDGDHIALSIPYSQVQAVESRNVGWRGLWIFGNRIEVCARHGGSEKSFVFLERASCTLLGSRRITARIFRGLSDKVRSAQQGSSNGAECAPVEPRSSPSTKRRKIIGVAVAILLLLWTVGLLMNPPVRHDEISFCSVCASMKCQAVWLFGFRSSAVVETSALAEWVAARQGAHEHDWHRVNMIGKNVLGRGVSIACLRSSRVPPICSLRGPAMAAFLREASEAEIGEFVRVMTTGSRDEQRRAVRRYRKLYAGEDD